MTKRYTTTKTEIALLARPVYQDVVLWGALGDAEVGRRDEKVGCVGCTGSLLAMCTGKS